MTMISKDLLKQQLLNNLSAAMKSEDEGAIAQAFTEFAESVQQRVLEDVKLYQETSDKEILTRRGIHQLTQKETKFYQGIITAMKSEDVRQAFTGLEVAFPETVIDRVINDIKAEHPLLDVIDFQNTTVLTKIVVNKKGVQLAKWGKIGSKISQELEGAIGKIDLTLCKLTAFMPISKDMLEVGPQWIDAYVRATLAEAIADALETAIITGTGKDEPIGMDRNVSDGVSVSGGVYPQKTPVVIKDLSPKTYGGLLAKLAKAPNGKTRAIDKVVFIANPVDYFNKVMPATTVQGTDGTYKNNIFPFPTDPIQSCGITEGKAIIGIPKKYFMGIGSGGKGGKIEYSDEYKFLDDERVYLTKLFGNGRALDDNAFILLDISKLEDLTVSVKVKGSIGTKAEA
ncbi:phage major capsid protein [Clostridium septicum]|uniref:phage major capsid protein n=1 Tax=Clostridium septicum TaxID=1504 RepID=UPI000ABDA08D|nr:phage major capsid protein [Clostridium septicum]